jgi:hypothetical protein
MNFYGVADADRDERFREELRAERRRMAEARRLRNAGVGRDPRRPVLVGDLQEVAGKIRKIA